LAEAYQSNGELRAENNDLRHENEALKRQLAEMDAEREEDTRKWQQQEKVLRKKLQRREEAVREVREMTRELYETQHDSNVHIGSRSEPSRKSASHNRRSSSRSGREPEAQSKITRQVQDEIHKAGTTENSSRRGRRSSAAASMKPQTTSLARSRSRSKSKPRQRSRSAQRPTREEVLDSDSSDEESLDESTILVQRATQEVETEESSDGSDFFSILEDGEMAQLRQILARERARQKERIAAGTLRRDDTVRSTKSRYSQGGEDHKLQRKSSNKNLAGILKNANRAGVEEDTIRSNVSGRRREAENSILSRTSNRQRIDENMTSAFIIPDITIHGLNAPHDHPMLSASARKVLDNLAQHDGHNCTVCTRIASFDRTENTSGTKTEVKQTVNVERPIPVSDRMPVAGPYEDEPTMRPSVAPGLALATVLKGLQDELAHLKIELAQFQSMYNKHDASLSKRKRKSLHMRIEGLLKKIDRKSDQIYALYDVLEGQKESGNEMTEKEVEVTLMSIGIAPGNNDTESSEESDADSELDLPWEGIEDTRSEGRGNWR
jgi:hypothetical protein